jgi:hypothetical protein
MQDPSLRHNLPRFGCFFGTLKLSAGQILRRFAGTTACHHILFSSDRRFALALQFCNLRRLLCFLWSGGSRPLSEFPDDLLWLKTSFAATHIVLLSTLCYHESHSLGGAVFGDQAKAI